MDQQGHGEAPTVGILVAFLLPYWQGFCGRVPVLSCGGVYAKRVEEACPSRGGGLSNLLFCCCDCTSIVKEYTRTNYTSILCFLGGWFTTAAHG